MVDLNLNVDNTNNLRKCYVCENICDCNTLKAMKKIDSKPVVLSKFLAEAVLPDLDLIDEINTEAIIKCRKATEENRNISICTQNVTTICKNDNANCSGNFDLEFDLDALDEMKSPEAMVMNSSEVNVSSDKNFDLGDIDDIFADSSPEEAIQTHMQAAEKTEKVHKPTAAQKVLGFFGLDSIDDIFADDEDDDTQYSSNPATCRRNVNSNKYNPAEDSLVIEPEKVSNETPKETNKHTELFVDGSVSNSSYPVSPSILTRKQVVKEIPTSPILCSQARKFQLSTKKNRPQTSTPISSAKKKLLLSEPDNSEVIVIEDDKDQKTLSSSVANTTDKSMYTITQIVEIINKTNDSLLKQTVKTSVDASTKESRRSMSPILLTQADKNKPAKTLKTTVDARPKENQRSMSPILFTQSDRNKPAKKYNFKTDAKEYNNNKRESLIILDSDSDFEDTQIYNVEEEKSKIDADVVIEQNDSQIGSKRKFDPDESSLTASPYFSKKQKVDNETEKPLTLQEKVLAAITSNKAKTIKNNDEDKLTKSTNNQANFHFTVSQLNAFSQKENQNPVNKITEYNLDKKEEEEIKPSPINMLQKYRKESKLQTLRSKFDSIFNKKSPKKIIKSPQKNIIGESANFEIEDRLFSPKRITSRDDNKETTAVKRMISFDDSEDDFINDDQDSSHSPKKPVNKLKEIRATTNHKVRKVS